MPFHQFKGSGPIPNYTPSKEVPEGRDPNGYLAGRELAQAVNVALALKRPLLVTGEPGTGKTELAYRMAAELGLGEVLRFDTKSSSQATDLFYQFDSLRQFAHVQLDTALKREPSPASRFLRIQAFGRAILRTLPPQEVGEFLGIEVGHPEPRSSLVLVDELDKAPRDFPNDLLNQIEHLEFSVPELGRDRPIRANPEFAPVVVITSNSEKQLPEAFLRRCVYHHIGFPSKREDLERILAGRLGKLGMKGEGAGRLMDWFLRVREGGQLEKKPSTSELLDWMRALSLAGLQTDRPLDDPDQKALLANSLGCLFKTQRDLDAGQAALAQLGSGT